MSRFSNRRVTKSGTRGERAMATVQGDTLLNRTVSKEPLVSNEPRDDETASVGLSVSVGHSSDYGKDKFEVAAWCTLPCVPSGPARETAYDQCKADVYERIKELREEVVKVFNLPFEEGDDRRELE